MASIVNSKDVAKGVVMIEVTSRDVSVSQPYLCHGRDKCSGSGFRIASKWFPQNAEWCDDKCMLFLTNFHVVEGAENMKVRVRTAKSPEYCTGTVVHCVPALDFALIRVETAAEDTLDEMFDPFCAAPSTVLEGVMPIELYVGPVTPAQQKIIACGFPMGYLEQYVSKGTLSGRLSGDDISDFYSMDLSINSGNSGGPVVFEGDGRVFAISTATESGDALQISYSVPISSILSWFHNWYEPNTVLGRFPRWSFGLMPRTQAFDTEHAFPHSLEGAIVCGKRRSCAYPIKNGDVLLSVHQTGFTAELDKFGYVSDQQHGEPRFCVQNKGFVASCNAETTTVTVWRPSLKATRTFKCAPEPQCEPEKMCFTEFAPPHYCALGSMVFMNATPDFLSGNSPEDSDDEPAMPASAAFHILRKIHQDKQRYVVVLSHFHENAYVSSTRTLAVGDIVRKIGRTEIKSSQHAEKVVQRLATEHANGVRKRVKITTDKAQVWLDVEMLLQEEKLCADERDQEKLLLLKSHALALMNVKAPRAAGRKRTSKRSRVTKAVRSAVDAPGVPNSRPGSPTADVKRRRSLRLAVH